MILNETYELEPQKHLNKDEVRIFGWTAKLGDSLGIIGRKLMESDIRCCN